MNDLFTSPQVDGGASPSATSSPAAGSPPPAAVPLFTKPAVDEAEMLAEIDDEILWRRGVYARRVEEKRMSERQATRKIEVMQHIRSVVGRLEGNATFFRACLKHQLVIQECIDVLEGRGK